MRKVMVSHRVNIPGTHGFKTEEKGEAVFHQFGVDYEEFDNGPGNFSTAIVEWPDGKVDGVPLAFVRFIR